MDVPFRSSPRPTVGVEWEFALVDQGPGTGVHRVEQVGRGVGEVAGGPVDEGELPLDADGRAG